MNDDHIQRGLEQDARRCRERIPMELTKSKVKEMSRKLKDFLEEEGLAQADVARAIGVSSSMISQFIKGKYPGNTRTLVNKIVNYIDTYYRKQQHSKGKGFVETTVAKRIGTLIKTAELFSDEKEGKIGVVIGDAGHGKSECLRQYAKANANSIYVELDDTMTSTAMFSEIARTLKIDHIGPLKSITQRLSFVLAERSMTIMLDEASALNVVQLSQLRQVITVRSKCPLVIAGNSHLLGTINQPLTKRGYESLDQFRSRIVYVLNLDELAASGDNGGLYTAADIRRLYEHGGIKLTTDAVRTLKKICCAPQSGRLRTWSHIFAALSVSPVIKKGTQVDSTIIISAIRQLGLPVMNALPVGWLTQKEDQENQAVAAAG